MVSTVNSTTLLMVLLFVGVATFFLKSAASAIPVITEGPVSVTALIGTNAQFHCAGTGTDLVWVVDGLQTEHPYIVARGITTELVKSSGTVQSNLTVPATSVNNGTTVRCGVIAGFGGTSAVSYHANLTVLQGVSVGPVLNLRFSSSFTTITWDPPQTAGVLSGLSYHLTVTNMNTGVVIINTTTTDTSYTLGSIQYCVNYTANVHTDGTVPVHTMARTPGGDYIILQNVNLVVVGQNNTVKVIFNLQLQLPTNQLGPCKTQKLFTEIRFQLNNSEFTKQEQLIEGHNITYVFKYSIFMKKSLQFIALISIGDQNPTIVHFTTFGVQHCDVHTDHTSYILVECTFAINSTAPGFVLIQDEHSQYTINTALQRHEGDVSKGSVNITDLPTGEYNVTVYDEMEDNLHKTSPAFTLSKPIHFESVSDLPTPVVSPSVTSSSTAGSQSSSSFYNTLTPTPTLSSDQKSLIAAVIPTGVVIILIVFMLFVFFVIGLYIKRHRKFADKADVSTSDKKSGNDNQQVHQAHPDFCLQMSSLTISSDGSSTDRSPQNAPPILPANNKEEKSAHIGSSDDESTPTRSAAVRVDISTSQTAVSEVHESQDSHHHSALAGSEKSPVEAVHDPKWYLTSGKCGPLADQQPRPPADQLPLPSADQLHVPLPANQQSLSSANQQPLSSANQQPLSSADQLPLPSADQQSLPSVDQRLLTSADQLPLPSADQQPITSSDQPPLPSDQQPLPSSDQQPLPSADQQPLPSADQQPLPSADQQPLQEAPLSSLFSQVTPSSLTPSDGQKQSANEFELTTLPSIVSDGHEVVQTQPQSAKEQKLLPHTDSLSIPAGTMHVFPPRNSVRVDQLDDDGASYGASAEAETEKKSASMVGNVPVIVRSQKKRAVGRAGDTDESSNDPVSQSLRAYHDFHDLNPKSMDLGSPHSPSSPNGSPKAIKKELDETTGQS